MKNKKWKNLNLKWNVFLYNYNLKKVIVYNVLQSNSLIDEIHKAYNKKEIIDYESLRDKIHGYILYHFWCKSEYEIAIGGLFTKNELELVKIDIYTQLMINFDRFIEYIINSIGFDYVKKDYNWKYYDLWWISNIN